MKKKVKDGKKLPASKKRSRPFPIVAIGASAGGLEAITQLLQALPANTDMAYVYIQHLDPNFKSMLAPILSKATKMKVVSAKNLLPIERNHVYIIPPNKEMSIVDGKIRVTPRPSKPFLSLPVDRFFISLAEKQREGAIGIVLSGNASDGAMGLKAIKMAGGLTFAQDATAKFPSMPKSAIAEGGVDMVLPPRQIATELVRLSKQANVLQSLMLQEQESDGDVPKEISETDITDILHLVKKSTGVDFIHYKKNTISRRIMRRMVLHKLNSFKSYLQYLKQHTEEVHLLYQDLLINVTGFFRDEAGMEYLKKNVLPKIIKSKTSNEPVRIWVPACSSGQEAYSLAMLLIEILGDKATDVAIQIFATDLNEAVINKARKGIFSKSEVSDVNTRRLQRFFTKVDSNNYRINKSIRDLCVFAPHNIFKNPPFSRIDLISCCNLFIYLEPPLQKKIIGIFHYALNRGGILSLGKSESIGGSPLFTPLDKKSKIYVKKSDVLSRETFETSFRPPEIIKSEAITKRVVARKEAPADLDRAVDEILLTRYILPAVIINKELDIVQFRGSTGPFLEPAPGKASLNILKMARGGISFELRNAIHKMMKLGQPVKKTNIEVKRKGLVHLVSFEIFPFKGELDETLYLITFEDCPPLVQEISGELKNKKVKQLEHELEAAKEDMRSVVEEQEAINEELQSANEEIVSSNEELQSINEELETSKEELESANEELMTINNELQLRNDQLGEAYDYSETLLDVMGEALMVLTTDLRLKRCNESFYRIFGVTEKDTEGKFIYELGNGQWNNSRLLELLDKIANKGTAFERFRIEHKFPVIGEKIMLLHARKIIQKKHNQELIVVAIEDITEHIAAQKLLQERKDWFQSMADNSPALMWVADTKGLRIFFNKTWLQFTGSTIDQNIGDGWKRFVHADDLESFLKLYNSSLQNRKPYQLEYRLRRNDGQYRWVISTGKPSSTDDGAYTGYIGICYEIHSQRMMNEELEEKVRERTQELLEANNSLAQSNSELSQFAYVASHDLQEPLRKIITYADVLNGNLENKDIEKNKVTIERIISSSERMRQLIDDLLNLSRTVSAAQDFEIVSLQSIIKQSLIDLDLLISEKKAKIQYDKLPAVEGIPLQMKQLFFNLINNSLKFSKEKVPPVINITYRPFSPSELANHPRLDKTLSYVEIILSDNGIGFEAQYAEQIFVIFQRLLTQERTSGTGIGLALCQRIVNNHGGEIFAEGKPGKGSTFHIILPIKQKE